MTKHVIFYLRSQVCSSMCSGIVAIFSVFVIEHCCRAFIHKTCSTFVSKLWLFKLILNHKQTFDIYNSGLYYVKKGYLGVALVSSYWWWMCFLSKETTDHHLLKTIASVRRALFLFQLKQWSSKIVQIILQTRCYLCMHEQDSKRLPLLMCVHELKEEMAGKEQETTNQLSWLQLGPSSSSGLEEEANWDGVC